MVREFFAVTMTSVYHVTMEDEVTAVATKIALKGKSGFPVGHRLSRGNMIAIGERLLAYIPEGGGLTSQVVFHERNPEMINTYYHGDMTSRVVGFFRVRDEAIECIGQPDLKPYDERWLESTRAVIAEIGDKHPTFYICRSGSLALPELVAA